MDRSTFQRPEFWTTLALLAMFLVTVPGLFALPAEYILFNPQSYKDELNRLDVYESFPLLIGETLADSSDTLLPGLGDRLLTVLDRSHYQQVTRLLFPPEWVRAQAESLIDQFWAFFNFQSPRLTLQVDFRPVKERLTGENLAIVQTIVAVLPPCEAGDLFQYGLDTLQGKPAELPLCQPPEGMVDVTNNVLSTALRQAAALLPESLDLAGMAALTKMIPLTGGAAGDGQTSTAWALYRAFRVATPWLPLLALILFVAVIFSARRTRRGAIFWSGAALASPGFAALLIALLLVVWNNQMVPALIGNFFFADITIFELLVRLVQGVSSRFLTWAAALSLAFTLLGLLLVGISLRPASSPRPPREA